MHSVSVYVSMYIVALYAYFLGDKRYLKYFFYLNEQE